MSKELSEKDREQLDQLLEQQKQISSRISQIELQKRELDKQKDDLLDNYQNVSQNLQSKMAEIKRVYEVDDTYNYDRVSGELVQSGG